MHNYLSCRQKDWFPVYFQNFKNDALTLSSGYDSSPWPLLNIINNFDLVILSFGLSKVTDGNDV